MLFDPKWEVDTKPTPTLAGFIAWLETQPPDKEYDWHDVRGCIVCQYFQSLGYAKPWTVAYDIHEDGYAGPFGGLAGYHAVGTPLPWTFGAALERARSLAARPL